VGLLSLAGALGLFDLIWALADTEEVREGVPKIALKGEETACGTRPLSGSRLTLTTSDSEVLSGRSDAEGNVRFDLSQTMLASRNASAPDRDRQGRVLVGTVSAPDLNVSAKFSLSAPRYRVLAKHLEKMRRQRLPPVLKLAVDLDDAAGDGNGQLDAGERADLLVRVANKGRGPAFGVKVSVKLKDRALGRHVRLPRSQETVGTIPPGGSPVLKIPLQAGERLPEGKLQLRVETSEEMGFGAPPLLSVIRTRALPPPRIVIMKYHINDGQGPYAQGDGDKIVERGEAVELVLTIANVGSGLAKNLEVILRSNTAGIRLTRSKVELKDLPAGTRRTFKLAFAVPRGARLRGGKLPLLVHLKESRPRFSR